MTDDASPENLRKFLESDDPAMRIMGLSMAKGSGVPEELHLTLLGILLWDSEEGIREAAKNLVDEIGIKNIPEFRGLESLDNDVDIRCAAVAALEKIGNKQAVRPLINALNDWQVRESATEALEKIGKPAVELLIKAFEDESVDDRSFFAELLGKIGDARAVESLIKTLENNDVYLGRSAAWALGDIGDTRAVEPLIKALWDYSHHLVDAAASALADIGDERAVEPLVLLMTGSYVQRRFPRRCYEIRESLAGVLVCFGELAVEPLIEALVEEDEEVRSYAEYALKEIGVPHAMEVLAKLHEDPEQFRIEAHIKAIGDNEEGVSNDALDALVGIGEPEPLIKAATRLIDTGAVREWQVEMLGQREVIQGWGLCQIANALGAIGDARAIELLIRIITDENVGWDCGPEEAVRALGKIGDERAVEPLIEALEDENIRDAAKEALKKLGHEVK
jgi:HEAT repeat protein